ncbi:UV-endonuclease UvdE-domain-containing protein [Roridomyces roridus]|uniref:UV-endonuclease UvdE-domain-containing protein n=1 Tax=Roridomyces roridus TaxID=1738132 RepID=A0AAD7CE46_9AGAR|nr:UV-endonuclease UvdE-domain-containing protein [Roridomyces roridus]
MLLRPSLFFLPAVRLRMAAPARRSLRMNAEKISAVATTTATATTGKRKRSTQAELDTAVEAETSLTTAKKARKEKPKAPNASVPAIYPAASPKKQRKPRQPKPEPVYVIPEVEKKETTFKGRLGPAKDAVFCSRTCRIDSIKKNGIDWVKELGRKNVEDLLTMIQWNEDHKIRFLRMSSEMFPFASHGTYGYSLDYCAPLLAQVGELAKKLGHRLTTHPGQFTQLGSPKPGIVESSVRELAYHGQMMDLMGLGPDGVMIVHGGGVYDDKVGTLGRIKKTITGVLDPNVRKRLVLENDEMCYNAEDLLPLCEELDVPLVFDYHHDALFPSSIPPTEIIKRANAIWVKRGIKPKQHLSEPRPGAVTLMERRAHADRCESLPMDLPDDMDLMIEAKDKEQAVFHLYRIYGLEEVKQESLRPPNENQTKETKGRKAASRSKTKKVEHVSDSAEDDSEQEESE